MAAAAIPFTGLIEAHLAAVEARFAAELQSDLSSVNSLVAHVSKFRGKMLRPMLVLLSGLAAQDGPQPLTSDHVTLATVVEMVHMATLVHDDVLDDAEIRRRGATINYLHGNEAAVLLGDFLISHAFHLCSSLNSQACSRLIGRATNVICEGELTQNFYRGKWELDEKTYFTIIYRKTAVLTETCCRLGAMISTERPEVIETMATFGKKIGLAFQIVDDILDITGLQKTVGKTLGTDIEKGKLTLPMIHFLKTAAPQHRDLLIGLLESHEHDHAERVKQLLAPTDSIPFAMRKAESLVAEAVLALESLPPSEARGTLAEMAQYVIERDK